MIKSGKKQKKTKKMENPVSHPCMVALWGPAHLIIRPFMQRKNYKFGVKPSLVPELAGEPSRSQRLPGLKTAPSIPRVKAGDSPKWAHRTSVPLKSGQIRRKKCCYKLILVGWFDR